MLQKLKCNIDLYQTQIKIVLDSSKIFLLYRYLFTVIVSKTLKYFPLPLQLICTNEMLIFVDLKMKYICKISSDSIQSKRWISEYHGNQITAYAGEGKVSQNCTSSDRSIQKQCICLQVYS